MNDASLPKPTPPQQTPLQPNVPVTPAQPLSTITAPPVTAPPSASKVGASTPPLGVPTPMAQAVPQAQPPVSPKQPQNTSTPAPASQSKPLVVSPAADAPVPTPTPVPAPARVPAPSPTPPVSGGPKPSVPPPAAPPPGSPSKPSAPTPAVAQPRKSPLKYLPFMVIGLVVVAIIGFILMRVFGSSGTQSADTSDAGQQGSGTTRQAVPNKQVTLQYWGLWEPNEVLAEVFQEYEQQNPGVKVQYSQQSHKDYRERLQTAIAGGQGPDLFRYHASWVPMLRSELSAVPSSVISAAEFKSTYYPAANKMLQSNGQIVGIPLMYDGLALLYNKEIFENSGDVPPKTWAELRSLAAKLVSRSNGMVLRGGVALGGTANVEGFSDVLGLLMLQNGADPKKPNSPQTRDALLFYTNFLKSDAVWSDALPSSSVAFARGDVAMIFAPSWRIHEILATNPNIKIGVAPLPKLSDERLAWATFWAEGISSKSQNKEEAAALLKYLSSPAVLKKMYSSASKTRAFGEIYPRVDMASELAGDPLIGAYLADAPYADGWYMSSLTHDNGINDQVIKYYEDAINAVNTGKPTDDVLKTVDQGVTQVLRQYSAQ